MSKVANFTVSVDKSSTDPITVDYTTVDGTAKSGVDYTLTSGTITLPSNTLTEIISVPLLDSNPKSDIAFSVTISNPKNAILSSITTGVVTIPGSGSDVPTKDLIVSGKGGAYDRFDWLYRTMMDPEYGYFGPKSGPTKNKVPYHMVEDIIVEAPDWGQETVSETASFYSKLTAWRGIVSNDFTDFKNSWDIIEECYIPNSTLQPWGEYNATSPAQVIPDATTIEETPLGPSSTLTAGKDTLSDALETAYGTKALYLMHWLIDVDGIYGFKNGDGSTQNVMINNYQRGPVEDGWATITHHCWEDFSNGGGTYGFLPIYGQGTPNYPNASGSYAKQWSYSVAPDAESRSIISTALLQLSNTSTDISTYVTKAKKMADYQRYAFFDKYFRPINGGYGGDGCHYLLSWGCGFGGAVPTTSTGTAEWGFRIGNSEIHHGYNCVDVAYMCSSKTDPTIKWTLSANGSNDMYEISLSRQIEFIRWLQSPEGPIAGGCTSNYNGNYGTPTDGREKATFYGLYYTYSPSWHNPPSNNWVGYQNWSMERLARLYRMISSNTNSYEKGIAPNLKIILDKYVVWLYNSTTVTDTSLSMATTLSWVEKTSTSETASKPNAEGDYEYLPTLNWDSSGDYGNFWNASTVPNPSLHCKISTSGLDIGSAAAACQTIIQYCRGIKDSGVDLSTVIPNSSITYENLLDLSGKILKCIWDNYKDARGFSTNESLSAYTRMNDTLFIPTEFGTGNMPDGSILANGKTTFLSMRQFYKTSKYWSALEAYINGTGTAPEINYHRFWQNAEVGVTFAMFHEYFPDLESNYFS